ncbi:MAG: ArsR family transcriptional regulator, partial [Moorea sp. SIO4A3]|nr:ArsR family transcriptional regulator [Moorena sp. SIO4A3]
MTDSSSLNKPTVHSSDAPSCDESVVHLDNVWQLQSKVLATEKAQQMAE